MRIVKPFSSFGVKKIPNAVGAGSDEEDAGTAAQREARAGMKDDTGGFSDSDGEDDRADRASNTDSFSGKNRFRNFLCPRCFMKNVL